MQDEALGGSSCAPPESVESDPSKRYWRFEDILGSGACKTVFKAFDSSEGIEVAWNKVGLGSAAALNQDSILKKRLYSEIHVLKRLQHKHIMTFHDYWLDNKTNTLNFITELFTHGSLKRFRAKHKHLELQVLKKWAWQILQGLVYLHGHEPPIIHRDLKCDNIFINGVTGDLKIGDLGLATLWKGLAPLSVIGTPEFMAPEFYDEKYDEKVDVYAFGMLLLELVSMDYPYCECTNPASIYKKVSQGVYPASFQKIKHPELKEFIELCIAHEPCQRPEARQLLKHRFFNSIRKTMEPNRFPHEKSETELPPTTTTAVAAAAASRYSDQSSNEANTSSDVASVDQNGELHVPSVSSSLDSRSDHQVSETELDPFEELDSSSQNHNRVNIKIECTKVVGEPILDFLLEYQKPGGTIQTIQFPFNIEEDTAEQIIREMRDESSNEINILITEEEASTIGQLIGEEVAKWCVKDEVQLEAYVNVMRRQPTMESTLDTSISEEARLRIESKMEDMCETITAGQGRTHFFKTLDEHSSSIMDCMDSTLRKPTKLRLPLVEDEANSESCLNESQVLFPNSSSVELKGVEQWGQVVEAQRPPEGVVEEEEEGDGLSNNSSPIAIPKQRRFSANFERSHSLSSTYSESRFHHHSEGYDSPFGKSVIRRYSGKNFITTECQLSSSLKNHFKRSVSLAKECPDHNSPSLLDQSTPEVSAEVSFVYLEPSKGDGDSPVMVKSVGRSPEGVSKLETVKQESLKSQNTNTSLISVVKVKPSTPVSGGMPTLHELSSNQQSFKKTSSYQQKLQDRESARTKADEYAWRIAMEPLVRDSEDTVASQRTTYSPDDQSPRSSAQYLESNATVSSTEMGLRSQEFCNELDGQSVGPNVKPLDSHQERVQDHHHEHRRFGSDSFAFGGGLADLTLDHDELEFRSAFATPRHECHSEYHYGRTGSSKSESIRAFRKDTAGTGMIPTPQRRPTTPPTASMDFERTFQMDEKGLLTLQARQNLDRMFKSCDELSRMTPENPPSLPHPPHSIGDFSSTEIDSIFQVPHDIPRPASQNDKFRHFSNTNTIFNFSESPYVHQDSPPRSVGPHVPIAKKTTSTPLEQRASAEVRPVEGTISQELGKESSLKKKQRRRQAEEDIGRMQEQQLEGLCSGGAVGVGLHRPKTHRPSMNGSIHLS
eukprot:g1045.t1